MNKFPNDVITIIFEYDNTYKIKFQEVIAELKRLYNFYLKQVNILEESYLFYVNILPFHEFNQYIELSKRGFYKFYFDKYCSKNLLL